MTISELEFDTRINALLDAMNEMTGESDTDLTEAVQRVKDYCQEIVDALAGKTDAPASDTITITANGEGIDVAGYAYANIRVPRYPDYTVERGTLYFL